MGDVLMRGEIVVVGFFICVVLCYVYIEVCVVNLICNNRDGL